MTRIGGDGPRLHRTGGSERTAESKKTESASKKSEAKAHGGVQKSDTFSGAAAASTKAFPRTSWGDVKDMRRAMKKAKSKSDKIQKRPHPRTNPRKPKPGVTERPPIAMRYGLRPPSGGGVDVKPDAPPIAMRYGLRPPSGGGVDVKPDAPPIAMRYGMRPPSGGGGGDIVVPDSPPIAMRYGMRPPSGGGGGSTVTPEAPPVAMRYGMRPPTLGN